MQICRDLDHTDKIRRFDLAAAIRDPVGLIPSNYSADNHSDQIISDVSVDGKDEVSAPILLARLVRGSLQTPNNYFNEAVMIRQDPRAL